MMRLRNRIKKNAGFTLVELMIVLVLIGMVISGVYGFFFYTQTSFSTADKQTRLMQEVNLVVNSIGKDIRAAVKPNSVTDSVVIPSESQGNRIYIYGYTATETSKVYKCTAYRVSSDKTALQKAYYETATAPSKVSVNPFKDNFTESMWQTVVNGILLKDKENNKIVPFQDLSNAGDSKRKIKVTLVTNDLTAPLPNPTAIECTFTSRSKDTPNIN